MVNSFKENPFYGTNGLIALKFVCSIGVSGPIVVYSNVDWLDLDTIYIKVKFGRICVCTGKKVETVIFWKLLLPVNFNFVFAIN